MISGELDFVQKSKKTGEFVKARFEATEDDLERVAQEIKAMYDEVINLKFLNFPQEKFCGGCEYCLHLKG
jgi:hypothetical protein